MMQQPFSQKSLISNIYDYNTLGKEGIMQIFFFQFYLKQIGASRAMRRGSKVELKQKKMLARDSLPELFDLNFGLLIFSVNVYLCTSNLCFFFFFFSQLPYLIKDLSPLPLQQLCFLTVLGSSRAFSEEQGTEAAWGIL